jgi:hypothetical protein
MDAERPGCNGRLMKPSWVRGPNWRVENRWGTAGAVMMRAVPDEEADEAVIACTTIFQGYKICSFQHTN